MPSELLSRVDHDHRQRNATFILEKLPVAL
jgi:hypothetical protein